eukprot:TRINITY_DN13572_c0_g2_i2.p1 TRINITY_DN13572_c0_g2~~TRINITY_DN13572_c0_g2_i2.p1  ORF type:complete len:341 (+),score=66.36 TRINITY_DN13572_c0_g2_i2:68-1090(+)
MAQYDDPSYYQAMPAAAPSRKPKPKPRAGAPSPGRAIRSPPPPVVQDYEQDAGDYVAPEYAEPAPKPARKPPAPQRTASARATPGAKPKPSPAMAPQQDPAYAQEAPAPAPRRKPPATGSSPNLYAQDPSAVRSTGQKQPDSVRSTGQRAPDPSLRSTGQKAQDPSLRSTGQRQPDSLRSTGQKVPSRGSTPQLGPKAPSKQALAQDVNMNPQLSGYTTPSGTPGMKPQKKKPQMQYVYDQQSGQYYEYDPATGQYYEAPPEPSYTDLRNTAQEQPYGMAAGGLAPTVLLSDGSQPKLVVREKPAEFKIETPPEDDGCGAFLYALFCGPRIKVDQSKGKK